MKLDTGSRANTGEVEIKPLEAILSNSKNNGSKYQSGAIQTICSKEKAEDYQ